MSMQLTLTLTHPSSGKFESVNLPSFSNLSHLLEISVALLGLPGGQYSLMRNGGVLYNEAMGAGGTLSSAGVADGDMIAIIEMRAEPPATQVPAFSQPMDFSSLLGGPAAASAGNPWSTAASPPPSLDFSFLLRSQRPTAVQVVSFPGMPLADALDHNPSPDQLVPLLFHPDHKGLLKEMNHHTPALARNVIAAHEAGGIEGAIRTWRESVMKGMVSGMMNAMEQKKIEGDMSRRLETGDEEAKRFFKAKEAKAKVEEQYRSMVEDYPESLGHILMLYINTTLNGVPIQAFVDSGAQQSILSEEAAKKCGLIDLVDTRFAGKAVGVGVGKILGRVHLAPLQIGPHFFPCSLSVMEGAGLGDKNMEFLFGLDMLRRHRCRVDLELNALVLSISGANGAPTEHYPAMFLHEFDLDQKKGGTRDFDAKKSNEEVENLEKMLEEDSTDVDDTKKKE